VPTFIQYNFEKGVGQDALCRYTLPCPTRQTTTQIISGPRRKQAGTDRLRRRFGLATGDALILFKLGEICPRLNEI
jgi:hypothetical protein